MTGRSRSEDPSGDDRGPGRPGGGQYFGPRPDTPSRPRTVRVPVDGETIAFATDSATFSPGRLDAGTAVLLDCLPPLDHLPPGDLVDLGAGWGPIAVTLARRLPDRRVWAVEVNERARALCADNARTAGVADRVRVVAPGDPTDGTFAAVVSNPPIRIGKAALHELLTTWLDRLATHGEAWLVVHRHLGADSLARWMQDGGWEVERTNSRKGYRVLRVRRRST